MSVEEVVDEDEQMIEAVAVSEGISKEEVKKKYGDMLKSPTQRDRILQQLEPILTTAEKIGEVAKKLPPEMRESFSQIAALTVAKGERTDDPYGLREIEASAMRIKHAREMAKIYGEQEKAPTEETALSKVLDAQTKLLQNISDRLEGKEKSEMKDMLGQILEVLAGKPQGGGDKKMTPEDMRVEIQAEKDRSTNFLKEFGYKVEADSLTKDQWEVEKKKFEENVLQKMTDDPTQIQKLKDLLEKGGYKIVGGPISYDEALKMVQEAVEKVKGEKLDDAQLREVSNLIKGIAHDVTQTIFAPLASAYFSGPIGGEPSRTEPSTKREDSGQPS